MNTKVIHLHIANWRLDQAAGSPSERKLLKEQLAEDLYDMLDELIDDNDEDDTQ